MSRTQKSVIVILTVGLALIAGVALSILLENVDRLNTPELVVVTRSILLLLILWLPVVLRTKSFDIFEPNVVFTFLLSMLYAVRPWYIIVQPDTAIWTKIGFLIVGEEDIVYAQNIAILGVVGILAGYYFPGLSESEERQSGEMLADPATQFISPGWLLALYYALAAASIALLAVLIGPANVISNPGRVRKLLAGLFYFSIGLRVFDIATLVLWAKLRARNLAPAAFWLLVLISNALNLLMGDRNAILILAASLWMIDGYIRRPESKVRSLLKPARRTLIGVTVGAGLSAVVFLIPVVRTTPQAIFYPERITNRIQEEVLPAIDEKAMAEFITFDFLVAKMQQLRGAPDLLYGTTFLQYFTNVIPRSLWPDKPLPLDFEWGLYLFGIPLGSPITLIGELYVNFGLPGTFVGMALLGVGLRRLYQGFLRNQNNTGVIIIYVFSVANLYLILTRSFAIVATQYTILYILTLPFIRDHLWSSQLRSSEEEVETKYIAAHH